MSDIFHTRFSPYEFKDKTVETWKLEALLDAARWAPSSRNNQPWRFVVIDDPQQIKGMGDCFPQGNHWVLNLPVIIVACTDHAADPPYNDFSYAAFDTGMAVENLLLKAAELRLAGHPMGGFDKQKIKQALDIPDEIDVAATIGLGYPAGGKDRQRRELAEISHRGSWGAPFEVKLAPKVTITAEINVRYSDIDALGHVNNATYLTYLEQGRVAFFTRLGLVHAATEFNIIITDVSIKYLRPVVMGEPISVEVSAGENETKGFRFTYRVFNRDS